MPTQRRSVRLESTGYYNSQGQPGVIYRETTYRIFRGRRRGQRREEDRDSDIAWVDSDQTANNCSTSKINIKTALKKTAKKGFKYIVCILVNCLFIAVMRRDVSPPVSSDCLAGSSCSPEFPMDPNTEHVDMMQQLKVMQEDLLRVKRMTNNVFPAADMLPNFALKSLGARVLPQRSSHTYRTEAQRLSLFGFFPIWWPHVTQNAVIEGHSFLKPGNCWPFAGGRGHLSIALSQPATISQVTVGHVPKFLSPTGTISSAPQEFTVYGMENAGDEGVQLGTFLYDHDGDPFQTFTLPDPAKGVFRFVKLQVKSNWGHPDYTCLYSFRVHGKLAD